MSICYTVTKKVTFKYLFSFLEGYSKQPTVTNLKGQQNFFTTTKHKSKVPVTWEQNEMFLFFLSCVSRNMKQILNPFHVWSNRLHFKILGYCKNHF